MRLSFVKCHGSGNDFPLIDGRDQTLSDGEWADVARALADRDGPVGGDGLLVLMGAKDGCGFGQRMWNPDGSEAEMCLNGLRCVARAGLDAIGADAAKVWLVASRAEVERASDLAPGVATIRTLAGPASTDPGDVGLRVAAPVIDVAIPGVPSDRAFTAVAMPNPHLIAFVHRVDDDELSAVGRWAEAGPELLVDRANISFVEQRDKDTLFVRTFERGVGLTAACGSAMAASVFAAGLTGRVPFGREVTVLNAGGLVRGRASADGAVEISGNATFEWEGEVTIDGARAGDLTVTRRHDEEVAAWEAVTSA